LRIAVIGTGLASAPHFQSLQDLSSQIEVVWISGKHADAVAQKYGLMTASKAACLDDVLQDPSIRAALVLTPPNTHLEVVERLARAGKHVLVEKPLEISLERATALVESCETHGVMLCIMLQHRLSDAALELQRLVNSGELGQLVSAAASVRWWRPQSYYDDPGRGTLARDGGGVLMTQAIHTLDLLLSYTGLPQRVLGMAGTSPVHQMEGEDSAGALLQYAGGAVAVLQATTAAYPGYPERIELNFTRGSATLESGALKVALIGGRTWTSGNAASSGGGADPMAFDHGPHRAVLKDFISSVQAGGGSAVAGRSALAVQRVIDAIIASSSSGAAASP
jgi:predicted dehydrogenase